MNGDPTEAELLERELEGATLALASIVLQMGGEVRVDDVTLGEMGLHPTLVAFRDESKMQQVYQVRQQTS